MIGPLSPPRSPRRARRGELGAVVQSLSASFGEPLGSDAWQWLQRSRHGAIFVVEVKGRIVGTGAGLAFGETGWIGGIGVAPGHRRRGHASALTEEVVRWLERRGVRTLLLQATDQGAPVYRRLGFEDDGRYPMWAAPPLSRAAGLPAAARLLRRDDLPRVLALDRVGTGEDREVAVRGAWDTGGLAVDGPDGLLGYHLDCPWGAGPTIAHDPGAGLALLDAARRRGAVRLGVPEGNAEAVAALRDRGFASAPGTTRMRLGPPVGFRPQMVFGVFNPFWG